MKAKKNIEETNWKLLAKILFDSSDSKNMSDISQEDEVKGNESIVELTEQVNLFFSLKKYSSSEGWLNIKRRIDKRRISSIRQLFLSNPLVKVAVIVVFALLVGFSGYKLLFEKSSEEKMLEISSASEILKTVELSDGSIVSLNSNTRLNFPQKFKNDIREVYIEGEGFFEVKPDKNKPFVIHAGNADIKVLGTSFNVSAYPASAKIEVIVATGKVKVSNHQINTLDANEVILDPGEKGTLLCSDNTLVKTLNEDLNFMAWKTRHLVFKATSLDEVITNIEKVYKVEIEIADENLKDLLLSAQFNDYPLEFILNVIKKTFKIDIEYRNGLYILKAHS